jgi:methyltransferase (TIGR00027 family)
MKWDKSWAVQAGTTRPSKPATRFGTRDDRLSILRIRLHYRFENNFFKSGHHPKVRNLCRLGPFMLEGAQRAKDDLNPANTTAPGEPLIRNISDTARWIAFHRAEETDRPDALFRDPYARKLAGERGEAIARQMAGPGGDWSQPLRTYLFDSAIRSAIEAGADTVLNLAAGFDTRPYRMPVPKSLQWIEVDLPEILREKEEALRGAEPACRLERVALDLAAVPARQALFARVGASARRAVVVTEGLMVYLQPAEVVSLAKDLAATPAFRIWILDMMSPGLLKMLTKAWTGHFDASGSRLQFAPAEGPGFFEPLGWKPVSVQGLLKAAARAGRLPFFLRLVALLPESTGRQGGRPWGGVCVFERPA